MTALRFTGYVFGLAALLQIGTQAQAVQLDYRLELGLEHNDNINLSATDPIVENILRPALGFVLTEAGSAVQAHVDGVLEYRDYLRGTYGNDLRGQIGGHVNWVVLPERLYFVVDDYLGVNPIDTLVANSPSNLQQTNVLSVGPNLAFRLGSAMHGLAELRYANSYAENTNEFDSQRVAGAIHIIRDLSPTSQLSANANADYIDPTHTDGGPSYTRYGAYVRYARTLRLFDFGIDAGYTWLDSGPLYGSHSRPLLRATASWRSSERSTFTVSASNQYTDAASTMIDTVTRLVTPSLNTAIPSSIATGNAVASVPPYLDRRFSLSYDFHDERLTVRISPFFDKISYVTQNAVALAGNINQTNRGGSARAGWLLRPDFTIGVVASIFDSHYPGIDRTDHNRSLGGFLEQKWTPHWGWHLELNHYRRSITVAKQNTEQNIIYAGIVYTR